MKLAIFEDWYKTSVQSPRAILEPSAVDVPVMCVIVSEKLPTMHMAFMQPEIIFRRPPAMTQNLTECTSTTFIKKNKVEMVLMISSLIDLYSNLYVI